MRLRPGGILAIGSEPGYFTGNQHYPRWHTELVKELVDSDMKAVGGNASGHTVLLRKKFLTEKRT